MFIFVILLVVIVFVGYVKRSHSYWRRRNVITSEPTFLLGNSERIFLQQESYADNLRDVYLKFKAKGLRYCGYYMFLNPVWVVLDIDLVKRVMTTDFQHFVDRCIYVNEDNDPLTGQLFMQKGVKWRRLRAKFAHMFTPLKMKEILPLLLSCAEDLNHELDKLVSFGECVDIKDLAARYTTDIISTSVFGVNTKSLNNPNSEFRVMGKKALDLNASQAIKQFIAFTFPSLMDTLKMTIFPQKVIDFFMQTVKNTVEYREKNNVVHNDFMQQLVQLKNQVSSEKDTKSSEKGYELEPLSIEEITAHAFVFFLAGFETSSTTMEYFFYEMVQNLDIQDRLRQEIENVYMENDGKLTFDSLKKMWYLDNCIYETLRKYPALPIILRQCTENYKVPDTYLEIQKGTRVFIPIMGIHYDPEFFPEPEVFDPDRFTNENKQKRHPFTWLPFGEGPRACIGLRFGMLQTKVALATLIKNYRFTLNAKTPTPLVKNPKSFMLNTEGEIWLNVEKI